MWFQSKNDEKIAELMREVATLKHTIGLMESNFLSLRNKVNRGAGLREQEEAQENGKSASLTPEMQQFVAGLPEWDRQKLLSGEYSPDR